MLCGSYLINFQQINHFRENPEDRMRRDRGGLSHGAPRGPNARFQPLAGIKRFSRRLERVRSPPMKYHERNSPRQVIGMYRKGWTEYAALFQPPQQT